VWKGYYHRKGCGASRYSYGFLASEFCADCGKSVVQFLNPVEKTLKIK